MNSKIVLLLILSTIVVACHNGKKPNINSEMDNSKQWITYTPNKTSTKNKRVVLVSGDEEYRSEEALPQLAKILSTHHGFECSVLFAQNPENPGIIDPAYTLNIPGLHLLEEADLMILFTRFRALPDKQMRHFEKYLKEGKPVIGIRTATHAFRYKDTTSYWRHWGNYYNGPKQEWKGGFGQKILGVDWHSHHGRHGHQSTRGFFPKGKKEHPILNGVPDGAIWGPTDVYGLPLPINPEITPIVYGQVVERDGAYDDTDVLFGMKESDKTAAIPNPDKNIDLNNPMMPIVWSKSYQINEGIAGSSITSTIGASTDLLNESVRRLFVNATYHLLELSVPQKANVNLVGNYTPSQFKFQKEGYWTEKRMRVADME